MLAINNQEKLNEIVKDALSKSKNFPRWQNAINKAVVQMEIQPEFITWLPETKSIVIWNQETNGVHAANGICDCEAYKRGFPCFHRAMARIVRLYFEAMEAESKPLPAKEVKPENAPYLKPFVAKKIESVGNCRI